MCCLAAPRLPVLRAYCFTRAIFHASTHFFFSVCASLHTSFACHRSNVQTSTKRAYVAIYTPPALHRFRQVVLPCISRHKMPALRVLFEGASLINTPQRIFPERVHSSSCHTAQPATCATLCTKQYNSAKLAKCRIRFVARCAQSGCSIACRVRCPFRAYFL